MLLRVKIRFYYNESNITTQDLENGTFNISVTTPPLWFEFRWNNSDGNDYRCNRIITSGASGTQNITFYILVDKLIYGESTVYFNDSIVKYTYSFNDKTGVFINRPELDSYTYIYVYNNVTNNRMIIHSEVWDTTDQIYPWLLYEKHYFVGVGCSQLVIDRVGIAPTGTNTAPQITIDKTKNITYFLQDIIDLRVDWCAPPTGFYVNYYDTAVETNSVTFNVYNYTSSALIYTNTSLLFVKNFTYAAANQSRPYIWELVIDHNYWSQNQTVRGIILPYISPITTVTRLTEVLDTIFGESPFVDPTTNVVVGWVYVMLFIVSFILLVTFGNEHAIGALASIGTWLMFAGAVIQGLSVAIIGVGFFLLCMAIIAALGGRR